MKQLVARSLRVVGTTAGWTAVLGLCLLQSRDVRWTASAQATGLVAAYGFDEGAGTIAPDLSGSGNTGTLAGATWTAPGKDGGGALSFNGATARVTVPDSASLDLTNALTIEAWVMPSIAQTWWTSIVFKDVDRYYLMASSDTGGRPAFGAAFGTTNQNTYAPAALPVNQWTHLAATYDRTMMRLHVNGVEVASSPQTAPLSTSNAVLTIGANIYGEHFSGLIDEVRIYNRALSAGEIQVDMGTALSSAPRLIINQPATGSAIASSTVNVLYSASGDLTGVDHVHFTLDARPQVMDLNFDGVYQFTAVPAGAHTLTGYLVRADHSAIPNTNTAVSFTTTVPDAVPPTVSLVSPAAGATVSGVITVSATASDDVAVGGVQFKLDGANLGAEDLGAPYETPLNTTLIANGAHTVTAVVRDLGGNTATTPQRAFTVNNTNPNNPAQIGQWSSVFDWPNVALHAALLPTGKVLSWADHTTGDGVQLWNPATNTFQNIPYTAANLFCAGLTFLADGRLVALGGHISNYVGLKNTTIFDPWSETWVAKTPMTYGRWYPTATILADGRILSTSGGTNCPDCNIPGAPQTGLASIAEIYNPATNLWSSLAGAPRRLPMYPHMFVLPDGRIFASSANADPIASAVLNVTAQTWTQIGPVLDGGSAVMYAPGKVMKSGSAWSVDYPINTAVANTYVIDMNLPSPAWRQTPAMSFARTEHNMTLLPDGTVVTIGGSRDSNVYDLGPAVYEAELWSPGTETWTTLARMDVPRHYHGTALLLPDARVLVTGSGTFGIDQKSAQIFSPPYLFKGARPVITSAPGAASYSTTIAVQTPDAARIGTVTAMAISAVTHAFDANQRIVPLSFVARAGALDVTLPSNANLMPPGYYLLFLVDTSGVPSVSTMLRVIPVADTVPPTAPSNLTASPAGTNITLSWAAATDNIGVTGYQVERCQGPGCNNFALVATTAGTTHLDLALQATTSYSYRVRATDGGGLLGPFSNIASATTGTTGPPATGLVAAYAFDEGSGGTVADGSGNALAGTIAGAAWTASGKYGSALSFNGSTSYVDLGNPAALRLTGSMTVEAWINAAANPADDGQIVAKSDGAGWQVKTSPDTGPHTFGLMVSGGGAPQRYSTTVRALNTWYHIAAVFDATARTMNTYVNGVLNNGTLVGTVPAAQVDAPVNVNIGRRTGGDGFHFNGLIDEVRIYNRALTPAEIAADMNTPVGGPPPSDTTLPTVSMVAPANGATATGTTTLTASASDNAAMGGVQFLLDGNPLGPEVAGPGPTYTYSWNSATAMNGPHTLSARARDAANNTATSGTVTVTASNDTTPPAVSLTSPAAGATVNGTLSILVSASDSSGIAGVQYLLDGANLGPEDTGAGPGYTYSWNTTTVANGAHTLSARARDTRNNTATATTVAITVSNDLTPPTVSVTSPAAGATLTGTVTLTATASDNSAMAGVQFLLDGANLSAEVTGAGPTYTLSWNTTTTTGGPHTISARARDTSNNLATGANVSVTVDTTAPTVSVTSPVGGATLTGDAAIIVSASDNVAVLGVQFLIDGANLGPEVTGPGPIYTYTWNTLAVADGPYTLSARARDAANNTATSGTVIVTASNDTTPPAVSVTAPTAGATVNGTLSILVSASDSSGIAGVQYLLDGANLGPELTGAGPGYTYSWNTMTVANGAHTLSARARDTRNNTATATTVAITVSNIDLTLPTVSVTSPAAGAALTGSVTLTATASDNVAMAGVRFLLDGANLGAEVTGAGPTYTLVWNTTTTAGGPHTISARARDTNNNLATAANVPVTLANDTTLPAVSVTSPAAGAALTGSVTLTATASDNVAMAGVRFRLDGVDLGAEVTGPGPTYTLNWNSATAMTGSHTFSALARDTANNTATSANVSATVSNAPSTALIAGYSFNAGSGTTAADSSANGITGTLSGATWITTGKYGKALSFNGTSGYVNLGNPAALAGTGSMTWAAWVYATGNPGDDGQIIAKSDNSSGWQFKTSPDTGTHKFAIGVAGSSGFVQRNSSTTRALNTWYHVAAVYNATTRMLDIYVNGVLNNGVLSGTVPASLTVPNVNVNIGQRPEGYLFLGRIDEARVYSRPLTQAEIQTVMNTPLLP